MTYLTERILQKPIIRSHLLILVLITLTLIAIRPSAVQAQWVGPNSNTLTTENNIGIGTLPQTNSQRLIVARRDQSQPSEIVIQNFATTGTEPGAVFRAMADQAHIQFASWTSSRPSTRFGIAVGGWNEVIAVGGNGIVYGTFNNSPVIFGTNSIAAMHISTTQKVGIGTNAPAYKLDVDGEIRSRSGGFRFPDGSLQEKAITSVFGRTGAVVAATDDYTWAQINKTTSSLGDLATRNAGDLNAGFLQAARMPALTGDVTSSAGTMVTALTSTGVTAGSYTNANITVDAKGRITAASNGSGGSTAFSDITAGTNTLALVVGSGGSLGVSGTGTINATSLTNAANITSGTVPITRLGTGTSDSTKFLRGDNTWTAITSSQWTTSGSNINYETPGNVGIGISTPTSRLHVVGDGKFTENLTVDGSINAKYQDVAEWVPSTHALTAGTVVTLDPTKSNHVEASSKAYDTRVAGVVSEQPGIVLGERGENKLLVATTGRVKVRVDASAGAIQVGDLLVTSDIEGLAIKSKPVDIGGVQIHRPGTIIGKALEPLTKGRGEILVLLSLQ